MKTSTDDLIRELSSGLKPVKPVSSAYFILGVFVLMGLGLMGIFLLATSGRSDLREYLGRPQAFLDLGVSFLLALSAGGVAIFLSRPGQVNQVRKLEVLSLALLGFALIDYGFRIVGLGDHEKALGLGSGGIECFLTVLIYTIGLGFLLIVWLRRGASVNPSLSGLMIGLAGLAFGNITISICCGVDNGVHILLWHLALPLLTVLILGIIAGRAFLKW